MKRNLVILMKFKCSLALMLGALTVQSADILNQLECHDLIVRQGVKTLILPKEVETLFGATNVDHFISGFGGNTQAPLWNSVAYFAGRYTLTLQVPISIDYDTCRLLGATNSAMVQINEVTEVHISKSGLAGASMKGQWRLNQNEWKWLVKNNGNWLSVRLPIRTNAPVKDFDEYVRQRREPIRNRKEGFDKPVKKAIEGLRKQSGNADQKQDKKEE